MVVIVLCLFLGVLWVVSVVSDCGISWSYYHAFCLTIAKDKGLFKHVIKAQFWNFLLLLDYLLTFWYVSYCTKAYNKHQCWRIKRLILQCIAFFRLKHVMFAGSEGPGMSAHLHRFT